MQVGRNFAGPVKLTFIFAASVYVAFCIPCVLTNGVNAVMNSLVDSVKAIAEVLKHIQATTSETFDNIFAPSISDLSQRSNAVTNICTTVYNAENRPKDQLWCMVLGRYLQKDLIKASHIYKRSWPVTYAVSPKYSLRCYAP